ncbi:MAG: hypothetical protein PHI66_00270 [Candidatus Pacebacteria bacterium]|nr:hypothetical protein [Candidatus Paceibacterota bacterium]
MEKDLSASILEEIRGKKIQPKSRWRFILREYVVWLVFFVNIFFGSLSVAVVLYLVGVSDWGLYHMLGNNPLGLVLVTLPYFWLLAFLIFLLVAYYYYEHTKTGYRYGFIKIVLLNILLSFVLGAGLYAIGAGEQAEIEFARRAPFYKDMKVRQNQIWNRPEEGIILGVIKEVDIENGQFFLKDLSGGSWLVEASGAKMHGGVTIERNFDVKVFGERQEEQIFIAKDIFPFMDKVDFSPRSVIIEIVPKHDFSGS